MVHNMNMSECYSILGIDSNSSKDDIKKAYRKLASKYHPDKNHTPDAEAKFKQVQEAYDYITNPPEESIYGGHGFAYNANSYNDLADILNMSRSGFSFSGGPRPTKKLFMVSISLEQAYTGTVLGSQFGDLRIPKGTRNKTKMEVPSHKAIIEINVNPHEKFKRSKDDLLLCASVNIFEALLGTEAMVTHLDGKKYKFNIPPGIQHGHIVKLTGKGMPNPEFDKYGNLLVKIDIIVPTDLTEEEKSVILNLNKVRKLTF